MQGDLLLLLVPSDRIGLFAQVGFELLVGLEELEALFVEGGRSLAVKLAELVAIPIVRQDRQFRDSRPERQLLPFERQARGQDGVLELVVLLRELSGDEPALARLPQAVQPLPLISFGLSFLAPQGAELIAAEQILVAGNDRRLLGDFLFAHANGPAFFGPLEQIPLQLFLELSGGAHRGGRHRENSIQRSAPGASPGCEPWRSTPPA